MDRAAEERIAQRYHELIPDFAHWEKIQDLIDQLLDLRAPNKLMRHYYPEQERSILSPQ